jgi:hypothetical protein
LDGIGGPPPTPPIEPPSSGGAGEFFQPPTDDLIERLAQPEPPRQIPQELPRQAIPQQAEPAPAEQIPEATPSEQIPEPILEQTTEPIPEQIPEPMAGANALEANRQATELAAQVQQSTEVAPQEAPALEALSLPQAAPEAVQQPVEPPQPIEAVQPVEAPQAPSYFERRRARIEMDIAKALLGMGNEGKISGGGAKFPTKIDVPFLQKNYNEDKSGQNRLTLSEITQSLDKMVSKNHPAVGVHGSGQGYSAKPGIRAFVEGANAPEAKAAPKAELPEGVAKVELSPYEGQKDTRLVTMNDGTVVQLMETNVNVNGNPTKNWNIFIEKKGAKDLRDIEPISVGLGNGSLNDALGRLQESVRAARSFLSAPGPAHKRVLYGHDFGPGANAPKAKAGPEAKAEGKPKVKAEAASKPERVGLKNVPGYEDGGYDQYEWIVEEVDGDASDPDAEILDRSRFNTPKEALDYARKLGSSASARVGVLRTTFATDGDGAGSDAVVDENYAYITDGELEPFDDNKTITKSARSKLNEALG